MSTSRLRSVVLVAALGVASGAGAQGRMGQGWSLLGAESLGADQNVLGAQLGFPGVTLTYLRGLNAIVDLGGRLTFNYGFEGLVTAIHPGLRGEGLVRIRLLDTGRFNLGVKGGVGLFGYFTPAFTLPGILLPLGLAMGFPIASAIVLSAGLDVPMYVTFGQTGGLTVPVLVGAGLEYFLHKQWEASLHARMGPTLNPTGFRAGANTEIAFELLLGTAFKI